MLEDTDAETEALSEELIDEDIEGLALTLLEVL